MAKKQDWVGGGFLRKQAPRFACHFRAKQNSKSGGVIFLNNFFDCQRKELKQSCDRMCPDIFNKTAMLYFLNTPFCHLQMTRCRRIRWTCGILEDMQLQPPWWVFFSLFNWQLFNFGHLKTISTSMTWTFPTNLCFLALSFNFWAFQPFSPEKNRWYTESAKIWTPKDVVNLGPEGRLIRSTELAKGLLRFGGLYCFLENFFHYGQSPWPWSRVELRQNYSLRRWHILSVF